MLRATYIYRIFRVARCRSGPLISVLFRNSEIVYGHTNRNDYYRACLTLSHAFGTRLLGLKRCDGCGHRNRLWGGWGGGRFTWTLCVGHCSVVRKKLAGRTWGERNHRSTAGVNPSRRRHKAHRGGGDFEYSRGHCDPARETYGKNDWVNYEQTLPADGRSSCHSRQRAFTLLIKIGR